MSDADVSLDVEVVALDTLELQDRNARKHSDRNLKAIADSLRTFGQRRPLVVWRDTIIAGNGTATAARNLLGWDRIAITRCPDEWTEDQARAFAIADNRTGELAEWDDTVLLETVTELEAAGFDVDLLALDDTPARAKPARTDADDEPPPAPEVPRTKVGDLWHIGPHRVLCGDAFDADAVARLIGDDTPAMVLTDPPYAIYGSATGIGSDIADDEMVRPFFEQLGRTIVGVVPEFAHVYVHCDWRSWASIWEGFKRAGLSPKNCIVWDKGGSGLGNNYANTHEFVGYFAKLPPPKAMTSHAKRGQRAVHRPNVLRYARPTGDDRLHNAAKPVAMLAELIENSSDPDAYVLDLFGGSGSTLIAADRAGRRALVMEKKAAQVDVIVARAERDLAHEARR